MAATTVLSGIELKRIVFGTDFSPVADTAATYARGLALSFAASVDVVHVFDTDVYLDDAEPRLRTLDDRLEHGLLLGDDLIALLEQGIHVMRNRFTSKQGRVGNRVA